MDDLRPDDPDPFRRRDPLPLGKEDLQRVPSLDFYNLLRQLMLRVEQLEAEMRKVKEKLQLP
jgi:hypothetical protein